MHKIVSFRITSILLFAVLLLSSCTDKSKMLLKTWRIENLPYSSPHHAVLNMPPLPVIYADSSMMEQVIVNLLSNAVKYSSKKAEPVVNVGFDETETEVTFHINDNGVGFDMQNYDRLFHAFQRLHGMSEFEGTGVGLMLVKRIIERHGGNVWGEGKVNEGATFYFTLPKKMHG